MAPSYFTGLLRSARNDSISDLTSSPATAKFVSGLEMVLRQTFIISVALCFLGACTRDSGVLPLPSSSRGIQNGIIDPPSAGASPVGVLINIEGNLCTATLVCPNVILAAYHCVGGLDPEDLRFSLRAGKPGKPVSYSSDWDSSFGIREKTFRRYAGLKANSITDLDGVALLRLSSDVSTSARFPRLSQTPFAFKNSDGIASIVGYGQNKKGGGAGIRRRGNLRFRRYEAPEEEFQKSLSQKDPDRSVLVRFDPEGEPPTASCGGDSGAPIFDGHGNLAAIVLSGGGKCGEVTNTLGFAVAYERDWLRGQMADWCSDF